MIRAGSPLLQTGNRAMKPLRFALAAALAAPLLSGCVAAAVTGAAVKTTGAVVGTAAKTTGKAARAVIPSGGDGDRGSYDGASYQGQSYGGQSYDGGGQSGGGYTRADAERDAGYR